MPERGRKYGFSLGLGNEFYRNCHATNSLRDSQVKNWLAGKGMISAKHRLDASPGALNGGRAVLNAGIKIFWAGTGIGSEAV